MISVPDASQKECNLSPENFVLRSLSSDKWIQEEERIIEISSNPSFETKPLKEISVRFVYLNSQQEIIETVSSVIPLLNTRLDWNEFISFVSDHSTLGQSLRSSPYASQKEYNLTPENFVRRSLRSIPDAEYFSFKEVSLFHIVKRFEAISSQPSAQYEKLIPTKDIKIRATLDIFHDLSELFVIMEPVKSILKNPGVSYTKTKRVKIMDMDDVSTRKTQRIRPKVL